MIWNISTEGKATVVNSQRIIFSPVGPVVVYRIGSEMFAETNDMMQTGIFRDKFIKEVLPLVRKELGINTVDIEALKSRIGK
jgi:hypothetical protein